MVCVIGEKGEHIVARRGGDFCTCPPFLRCQGTAKEIFCGTVCRTMLCQKVCAAEAKCRACSIADTVSDDRVQIAKSGDAVITGIEGAVRYPDILAPGQVNAVMSAEDCDVFAPDILTVKQCMGPIAGICNGISGKCDVLTAVKAEAVRSAIVLLSNAVIYITAIDAGAFFANDRDVLRVVCTEYGVAPSAACSQEGVIPRLTDLCTLPNPVGAFGIGDWLEQIVLKDRIVLRIR